MPNCSKEKSVLIKKNGVVYPPNEQYAPCECLENSLSPATIGLNCADRKANDSRISDVLDYFLASPDISPLGQLRLNNGLDKSSQLTRVPRQIKFFPQLNYVSLAINKITSIESGAFNFTATLLVLDLQRNEITTIAPGAFLGKKKLFYF